MHDAAHANIRKQLPLRYAATDMVAGRQGERHDPQATAERATRRQAIPGHRITLRSRVPAIVADDEGQPTWHRPRCSPFRRVERRSSCLWQRITLPARLSTSPTWDLMEARIAVRRWSPDMRSCRIAASPFFQRVATSCHAAQRRRNTLHNSYRFYVPSHPPSWDGCYPDWSSQVAFLARLSP